MAAAQAGPRRGSACIAAGGMQREPPRVFPKCCRMFRRVPGGENATGRAPIATECRENRDLARGIRSPYVIHGCESCTPGCERSSPGSLRDAAQPHDGEEREAWLRTPERQHQTGRAGTKDPWLTPQVDPLGFIPMLHLWGARHPTAALGAHPRSVAVLPPWG